MGIFRVGQKVVCVAPSWAHYQKGQHYTVAHVVTCGCGRSYVGCDGVVPNVPPSMADWRCGCGLRPKCEFLIYDLAKAFRPLIEDLTASLASKEVERLVPEAPERVNEPQHA